MTPRKVFVDRWSVMFRSQMPTNNVTTIKLDVDVNRLLIMTNH